MFDKKIKKASEIEVNTLRQRVSNIADSLLMTNKDIISLNNKFDKINNMMLSMNQRIDNLYEIIHKN
jgi:hypothetical protein